MRNGKPRWCVIEVVPRKDYTLLLTFADGRKGIYDFRPNLKYPVYQQHMNVGFFMQAEARCSSVVWPDDSDIDPELLYGTCISEE